jgi:EpsD family peptidyl-prolyl cis-trans isomerase
MRIEMVVALLFSTALTGCDRTGADRASGALVARVNGVEISARELRATGSTSVAQAVEKVIDRELLVQKALEAGLEHDPQVADRIDNARRDVLAQAYVERTAGSRALPTRDEVRAFYAENPALFAERRIYRTRELVVSANPEMLDLLRAQAARARDLDEVATWLRAREAHFSAAAQTQSAEQVPLAFLQQLARMKSGDIAVFAAPAAGALPVTASVIQLVHAEDAPLSQEQALPLIENFLAARRRLEVAAAEVKRLREAAKIEYVAQFKQSTTR